MTRRLRAVGPDETAPVESDDCLLCGAPVEPFWHPELQETVRYELCPRCAGAFQKIADRVADRVVAELQGRAVAPIVGQLELDGDEA